MSSTQTFTEPIIFLGYNNTVDIRSNIDLFMKDNMENILNLHKNQFAEETINHYSEKQYNVSLYYMALEYATNLWFFILENTESETIEASEKEYKVLYSYSDISHNLAHYGVDLDRIYNDVKITHTEIPEE